MFHICQDELNLIAAALQPIAAHIQTVVLWIRMKLSV